MTMHIATEGIVDVKGFLLAFFSRFKEGIFIKDCEKWAAK